MHTLIYRKTNPFFLADNKSSSRRFIINQQSDPTNALVACKNLIVLIHMESAESTAKILSNIIERVLGIYIFADLSIRHSL